MTIEQGDLRLLESDLAKRLLTSTIPARYAYTALDGTPRVVASWFEWTGEELVLPTFISAPHVSHAAYRVRALRANPDVAVTVDTEAFPPEVLSIRGTAEITEADGWCPNTPEPPIATSARNRGRPTSRGSTTRARAWRASRSVRPGSVSWTSRPGCRAPSAAPSYGSNLVD
jgi:hypothetical protein